jgi:hypothetical protein
LPHLRLRQDLTVCRKTSQERLGTQFSSKGWMGPAGDLFQTVTNWPALVGVVLAARNRTARPSRVNW